MQPEEAPRRKEVPGVKDAPAGNELPEEASAASRPGDLRARPFPVGDWAEPAERLDDLYRWAESGALQTAHWYLRDRAWKRRGARVLRLGAVLFACAGALLALLDLTVDMSGRGSWGYIALVLAGACVAVDRCFGLTSGWMRDISTAQAIQRRLEAFQFEWASESVREVLGPTQGTASEAAERCLAVLRRFCEDVTELVRVETSGWMLEFRSSLSQLHATPATAWEPRPESGPLPARVQLPPGSRANMPRQRPPEPPR